MEPLSRRVYRRFLALLPRDFRRRFGRDMEDVFAHRLAKAGSRPARAWTWLRGIGDIASHAVLERVRPHPTHEGHREDGMVGGMQDLKGAMRSLARSPTFAATAVLTLGLGIGASTATFSVVGTVLFEDLPYEDPERLVALWPGTNFNNAMLLEAREAMPAIGDASGLSAWGFTLVGEGEPLEVQGNRVTANHFRVLGVAPAVGRDFTEEEGLAGRNDVVILSHGFWVRLFGADPAVVGRRIELAGADATTRTVVGVMPPDFRSAVGRPEVWVPMGYDPADGLESDGTWFVNHRVARLAPGATLLQADQQVRAFARAMAERLPQQIGEEAVESASVVPYRDHVAGDLSPVL